LSPEKIGPQTKAKTQIFIFPATQQMLSFINTNTTATGLYGICIKRNKKEKESADRINLKYTDIFRKRRYGCDRKIRAATTIVAKDKSRNNFLNDYIFTIRVLAWESIYGKF